MNHIFLSILYLTLLVCCCELGMQDNDFLFSHNIEMEVEEKVEKEERVLDENWPSTNSADLTFSSGVSLSEEEESAYNSPIIAVPGIPPEYS